MIKHVLTILLLCISSPLSSADQTNLVFEEEDGFTVAYPKCWEKSLEPESKGVWHRAGLKPTLKCPISDRGSWKIIYPTKRWAFVTYEHGQEIPTKPAEGFEYQRNVNLNRTMVKFFRMKDGHWEAIFQCGPRDFLTVEFWEQAMKTATRSKPHIPAVFRKFLSNFRCPGKPYDDEAQELALTREKQKIETTQSRLLLGLSFGFNRCWQDNPAYFQIKPTEFCPKYQQTMETAEHEKTNLYWRAQVRCGNRIAFAYYSDSTSSDLLKKAQKEAKVPRVFQEWVSTFKCDMQSAIAFEIYERLTRAIANIPRESMHLKQKEVVSDSGHINNDEVRDLLSPLYIKAREVKESMDNRDQNGAIKLLNEMLKYYKSVTTGPEGTDKLVSEINSTIEEIKLK